MKCRDALQKAVAFVLSGCLLLGLSGCGEQTEPESSENQTQPVESQTPQEPDTVPYQEFNESDESTPPALNQEQPTSNESAFVYDEFWIGNWDEIGGRTRMTVAPTDVGYNVLIQGASGAADEFELRLKGECVSDRIVCTGEQWNIHYPDGGGNPTETLVSQDCVGALVKNLSGDGGYTIMYEDGEYGLQFVREGELLSDPFAGDNEDDGIPYVPDAWIEIIGQQFSPSAGYRVIGDYPPVTFCPANPINTVDGVVYYWVDEGRTDRYYGVKDGLIVAYMDMNYELPEVHTMLTADFDGIEPKIVTANQSKYLLWEVSNGYVVFWVVGDTGQGYLYNLVRAVSFFAYKEMFTSD